MGLLAVQAAPGQDASAPPYDAFLWIDAGYHLDDPSWESLCARGITGVNAEGAPGAARAAESGRLYYVDHAVPKGFLHVRAETFDAAREKWCREPDSDALARPVCLRDPEARRSAAAALRHALAACGPQAPAFVSFSDEPSATRSINPIDWCRDSFCADAFPRFLAVRWGGLDAARAAWGARWPEGGAPAQVDTDAARRALFHDVGSLHTVAQWNDTRAFAEAAFTDALRALADEARRARPGVRLGLLGATMPSAFGGYDWEELGPLFDVIEPYDWGATRDLARACAPQADLYRTLVPGDGGVVPLVHALWRNFLRGDRGVILYDASAWTRADAGRNGRAALDDIAPLLRLFQGDALAAWRRATPLRPQVAILHSMASTRLHWLLDTRYDGASWFNRLGSYEVRESSEALNREAWAALLSDLGYSYRFVTPRELRDGALLKDDATQALVLPRAIAMSDAEAAAVAAFAATRLVLADCQTAIFDARLQKRDKPALDELFGIGRPPIRTADDVIAHQADSRPNAHHVAAEPRIIPRGAAHAHAAGASPIVLVHRVGASRTVYLNLRVGSYVHDRLADPAAAERLAALLRPVFISTRVRPRFEVTQLSEGVRLPYAVHARRDGADILIAVEVAATTGSRPIDWSGPIATARPRVRIALPGTYRVTEIPSAHDFGHLNAIETEVSATLPRIFRLSP